MGVAGQVFLLGRRELGTLFSNWKKHTEDKSWNYLVIDKNHVLSLPNLAFVQDLNRHKIGPHVRMVL